MKNRSLSARERIMVLFLVALLVGVCYFLLFYQPLQTELASVAAQSAELDSQIEIATVKIASMDAMQQELDEILARPQAEITEIAPYDNAKVVMSQLNGILSASEDYSLNFKDPVIGEDGTVRREVDMSYTCADYASAKSIIEALAASHWRCLINSLSLGSSADNATANIMAGSINVKASITFFESTNLTT